MEFNNEEKNQNTVRKLMRPLCWGCKNQLPIKTAPTLEEKEESLDELFIDFEFDDQED